MILSSNIAKIYSFTLCTSTFKFSQHNKADHLCLKVLGNKTLSISIFRSHLILNKEKTRWLLVFILYYVDMILDHTWKTKDSHTLNLICLLLWSFWKIKLIPTACFVPNFKMATPCTPMQLGKFVNKRQLAICQLGAWMRTLYNY